MSKQLLRGIENLSIKQKHAYVIVLGRHCFSVKLAKDQRL